MRLVVLSSFTALAALCAAPTGAQVPTVQGAPVTRPYTTTVTVTTPAQQIAALQQQVAALQAAVAALQAKTQLVSSDGTNLTIKAPGNVSIQAQQNATVAASALAVSGVASVTVQGAMVQINGGGKPAARLGDGVGGNAIITGSPTVLIGP